jgi:hypothetical protein
VELFIQQVIAFVVLFIVLFAIPALNISASETSVSSLIAIFTDEQPIVVSLTAFVAGLSYFLIRWGSELEVSAYLKDDKSR